MFNDEIIADSASDNSLSESDSGALSISAYSHSFSDARKDSEDVISSVNSNSDNFLLNLASDYDFKNDVPHDNLIKPTRL